MKRKFALVLVVVLVIGLGFACVANYPDEEMDVQTQTYNFLIEEGFTPVQASGIMAAIKKNSNFDHTATSVPDGMDYGLLQWTYVRRENLENFADANGKPLESDETQLLFMIEELNSESEYYIGKHSYQGYSWADFFEAETPAQAAKSFYVVYSKPYIGVNLEQIGKWAEEFYQYYN